MIGLEIKRRRDRKHFRIVGKDGSMWAAAPLDHGPVLSLSTLEVSELFAVVGGTRDDEQPRPEIAVAGRAEAEQIGRERLAAVHSAGLAEKPVPSLSPEESFASGELTPEEIVSDPHYRSAFVGQRLPCSGRVAGEVWALLEAEADA